MNRSVLIFAKPPLIGLSKTRLARTLGKAEARRIARRLDKGLYEAQRGHVLFIGADAPDVSSNLIWQAFEALKTSDAVFGPASDGGFWLFGMHKGPRTISPFGNDVRWSGPHAMADVRANLGEGAKVAELPMLIDIDDADDWRAWRGKA